MTTEPTTDLRHQTAALMVEHNIALRQRAYPEQTVGDAHRFACKSSNIASVAYADGSRRLLVTFTNGGRYVYLDVDAPVYEALRRAQSVGGAFAALVRGRDYAYEKLTAVSEDAP